MRFTNDIPFAEVCKSNPSKYSTQHDFRLDNPKAKAPINPKTGEQIEAVTCKHCGEKAKRRLFHGVTPF